MRTVFIIIIAILALVVIFFQIQKFVVNNIDSLLASLENNIFAQNSEENNQEQSTSGETPVELKETKKTTTTKSYSKPNNPPVKNPGISINTFILDGPEEDEIIEETNQVTFEFSYGILPEETEDEVTFETKIEGFDDKWISTSSTKRTVTLDPVPKEYTFLVRAKVKDVVDLTPAKRKFKINVSPFLDKIKISSVHLQNSSSPSLITLRTYLDNDEEINIAGWNIRGKAGSFVIPSGIEIYQPGYNPVPEGGMLTKQGDIIYLSGGANPLGRNRNFRPNKCMGYLTNYYDFNISLPQNCPRPTKEEISHLGYCCREFILRMPSCSIPDYSDSLTVSTNPECVSYINNFFNYASCFYKHYKDDDFLRNNWHIYINKNIVVKNDCDTLYLRDADGLFVDKYDYGRPICY